jgi:hypothetical protein
MGRFGFLLAITAPVMLSNAVAGATETRASDQAIQTGDGTSAVERKLQCVAKGIATQVKPDASLHGATYQTDIVPASQGGCTCLVTVAKAVDLAGATAQVERTGCRQPIKAAAATNRGGMVTVGVVGVAALAGVAGLAGSSKPVSGQ